MVAYVNRPIIVTCLILMVIVSACGADMTPIATPTPELTATANEVLITPDVTKLSRDLPPTWTATYTPTITLTPTASATYTVTPSLTPINLDLMCKNFTVSLPEDGAIYSKDDVIKLSYGISKTYQYAYIGMILEHEETGEVIDDFLPGGTTYTPNIVVADFPRSGRWDYLVGIFLNNDVDIFCSQDGYFVIEEGAVHADQPNIIPTALAVPSVTPQAQPTDLEDCLTIC